MPKSRSTFTTSDLSRKSGDIIAEAMRAPVTITQRNKPRLVLMNIEDFERLRAHGDTRKAYRIEDMPDELVKEIEAALDAYERDTKTDAA
ncbi:type II toxin-antitoxin system prevent-host-death family antitoxin [Mesorhizobium australicum]|uniref:Antitoxin n=1 Tax=Mesorhizobium australicum TaxID=536018 RepID=A0A1X7NUF7_9HYPH|nr:type II toxin-antitoxin system prevent-host-death family antitoxin [Mesorhizobium australicum]SMH41275.1 prevent-host-death family protein [Mesorhizobium australicum]